MRVLLRIDRNRNGTGVVYNVDIQRYSIQKEFNDLGGAGIFEKILENYKNFGI